MDFVLLVQAADLNKDGHHLFLPLCSNVAKISTEKYPNSIAREADPRYQLPADTLDRPIASRGQLPIISFHLVRGSMK